MTSKADNFGLAGLVLISQERFASLRSSSRSRTEFYELSHDISAVVVAKDFLLACQLCSWGMGLAVPVKHTTF
jgi:hypothetical protein